MQKRLVAGEAVYALSMGEGVPVSRRYKKHNHHSRMCIHRPPRLRPASGSRPRRCCQHEEIQVAALGLDALLGQVQAER